MADKRKKRTSVRKIRRILKKNGFCKKKKTKSEIEEEALSAWI